MENKCFVVQSVQFLIQKSTSRFYKNICKFGCWFFAKLAYSWFKIWHKGLTDCMTAVTAPAATASAACHTQPMRHYETPLSGGNVGVGQRLVKNKKKTEKTIIYLFDKQPSATHQGSTCTSLGPIKPKKSAIFCLQCTVMPS